MAKFNLTYSRGSISLNVMVSVHNQTRRYLVRYIEEGTDFTDRLLAANPQIRTPTSLNRVTGYAYREVNMILTPIQIPIR